MILHSWQRCKDAVVSTELAQYYCIDQECLTTVLAKNRLLIEAATSTINNLLIYTQHANSHIILADKHGVVLYAAGRNLTPIGSVLTEEMLGTNGVGTCLVEQKPIYVMGPEHYLRQLHHSHCSAVPIFNARKELMGVMSLAVPRTSAHSHSLGMLEAAAATISKQLMLSELLQEQQTLMEVLNEGVLILDRHDRVYSINRYARNIFNVVSDVVGQPLAMVVAPDEALSTILASNKSCQDLEVRGQRRDSRWVTLTCSVTMTAEGHKIISVRDNCRTRAITRRAIGAKATYTFDNILGQSTAINKAIFQARQVSQSDATALIWGESGTGKELIAQSIHNASRRAKGPFIVVNCGAIPRDLIQSELFGYEAGAYTGALRGGAAGKFELADGGTIFLDEIGEMPLAAQVSLLRFLQEKEVVRVGGQNRQVVDVRVITATNKNLSLAVQQQQFRADLFYRINVLAINVPPLRERTGDIEHLANAFITHCANGLQQPAKALSHSALQRLTHYPWPGNVRELENVIERAINLSRSAVIEAEDIQLDPTFVASMPNDVAARAALQPAAQPSVFASAVGSYSDKVLLSDIAPYFPASGQLQASEYDTIIAALNATHGNLREAAKQLGISRSGLYNKVKRYQLAVETFRQ
ncbi:sigma 54-interacting transcriptional regulator [Shewanella avicenniae]|uniref:Sigma 54-interacting transcriptional regulator n=1 Tax=Shewanella avicenniae TaxID=2814294 RepID=A0ABX7QMS6_9GAMM|nr:sigma 54-interacting transcriptional regulator [Shewanella avicenniae]QSX32664.1 sigma 54-interacting transcriptional regulator [Shewanella avicenniae]